MSTAAALAPMTAESQARSARESQERRVLESQERHALVELLAGFLEGVLKTIKHEGAEDPVWLRRRIAAGLPPLGATCDAQDLRMASVHAGLEARLTRVQAGAPVTESMLLLPDDGIAMQLEAGAVVPAAGEAITAKPGRMRRGRPGDRARSSWFWAHATRLRSYFMHAFVLTMGVHVLSLAAPLFVMGVYDRVIGGGSIETLIWLAIGAAGALGFEIHLRHLRGKVLGEAGARLGFLVGNAVFARLLAIPSVITDQVCSSAQLARLRDLERLRELLAGPPGQACLEAPVVVLFLLVIALIGGQLVVAPLLAVIGFCVIACIMVRRQRRDSTGLALALGERQQLALEIIEKMRAVRTVTNASVWRKRFEIANAATIKAGAKQARTSAMIASVGQAIGMIAGMATLLYGTSLVMADKMSSGALIAAMIIVWRLLQLLQGVFASSVRISQMAASIQQIDALMNVPPEWSENGMPATAPEIDGAVSLRHVTFRYGREADPILSHVSFQVQPGEVVAVVGPSGSGKSTILKLIAGLYTPQMGTVRIDNRNVRQYDALALRQSIAFVPQLPRLCDGTIRSFLLSMAPLADEAALWESLEAIDAKTTVAALPEGLETPMEGVRSTGLQARLALAGAWIKKAPLVLLDEPASGFDPEGEFAFTSAVQRLRGKATVIFVTHSRSHLSIADRVIVVDGGVMTHFGPAQAFEDKPIRGIA